MAVKATWETGTANDGYKPRASTHWPTVLPTEHPGVTITAFGWKCPDCHAVNNPRLAQCLCRARKASWEPTLDLTISPIGEDTIKQVKEYLDTPFWNGLFGPFEYQDEEER